MARTKRWEIPFVSLNGTECRIDIYEENWTGEVTELSTENPNAPGLPAADPIYYEEEDSQDLLKVIRVKTGYINLVEMSYGSLVELNPKDNLQHYVEFYYGDRLDFNGYMQAQSFENDWVACPRTIAFPIQSPLGLVENVKFTPRNPVQSTTMTSCLDELNSKIKAIYTGYWLPTGYQIYLNSYLLSPFNDNVTKTDGSDQYDPMSFGEFLEGVCNMYGLILHDTPTALIFSKFEYSDTYQNMHSSGGTFPSGVVDNIADHFMIASENGKDSLIMPLSKITVDYSGDENRQRSVNVSRMAYVGMSVLNVWSGSPTFFGAAVAWMMMFSPEFYSSFMVYSNDITQGLVPANKGVIGAVIGTKECVVVYCNGSMGDNTRSILEWRVYMYPGFAESGFLKIQLNVTKHTIINDQGEEAQPFYISIEIDGEYYNDTTLEFDNDVHKYAIPPNNIFWVMCNVPKWGREMKITLWGSTLCTDGKLFTIDDFSVSVQPEKLYQFREEYKNSRIIEGSETSYEEGSVKMELSRDHFNTRSVTYAGTAGYTAPEYPYLKQSQNRLQMDFRGTMPDARNLYLYKWNYWITGWKWRVIAQSFHPWDDLYTLTLHRSPVIENN